MFNRYARGNQMQLRYRDGIALAFTDSGIHQNALVLVHGWGTDHTSLLRQQSFFEANYRVLNIDLRGHGDSSSPDQIYTVSEFAEDIDWLCSELGIKRAFVIGHSMGGAVALELAYRHPELVHAVVMLDTVFQAPPALTTLLAPLLPGLAGPGYANAYGQIMAALSLPSDLESLRDTLAALPMAPQHVLLSALKAHLEDHDFVAAASGCRVPVAYVGATRPLADLGALKSLLPGLLTGQTLGSGHFAPLVVADQVNAMLAHSLTLFNFVSKTEVV
jgi:pimeloyl-ACP methyl ester carboxylesterase